MSAGRSRWRIGGYREPAFRRVDLIGRILSRLGRRSPPPDVGAKFAKNAGESARVLELRKMADFREFDDARALTEGRGRSAVGAVVGAVGEAPEGEDGRG